MNKKSRQGKRFTKGKSSRGKETKNSFAPGEHDNDISWYTKYPALVEANSSLIFNTPYGATYQTEMAVNGGTFIRDNSIAGCVMLNFRTVLARGGLDADAINVAAKNLYTYVRHANSGSANYESSDLMQYLITVIHLGMEFEQCKRTLRLAMTFNPLNKYVYKAVLSAEGWDAAAIQNLYTNNANLVGYVNTIAAKLNSFKIPRDIALADKLEWMVTNVFKDDSLDKCTYYLYECNDHVHYDWANRAVTFTNLPISGPQGLTDRLDRINGELDNLLAYEDIGIMLGDILKAYKSEGCRVWSPMGLGEVQDASYSEEVLVQMMNTVTFQDTGVFTIKQVNANSQLLQIDDGPGSTPGLLTCSFGAKPAGTSITSFWINPVLSVDSNSPTNSDIIIATRNTNTIKIESSGTNYIGSLVYYPNTIVNDFTVVNCKDDGTFKITKNVHTIIFHDDGVFSGPLLRILAFRSNVSKFPNMMIYTYDNMGNEEHSILFAHGKNNQTLGYLWLRNLHDGCTLSELSMPMFKLLESN